MNPEEKSLLERTYKLVEENNEILRSIRRTTRFGMVFKTIYWVVIIGLSVGAIYFIQPYVDFMTNALGIGKSDTSTKSTTSSSATSEYIKNIQGLLEQ